MVLFVPIFEIEGFKKQIVFLFNSIKDPKYIQLHIKRLGIFEFEDFDYVPRECQFCINENHSKHKNAYAKEIIKNIFFSDYHPLYLRYFQKQRLRLFFKMVLSVWYCKYKQIESVLSHFVVFG
jgi:hypothetical protein